MGRCSLNGKNREELKLAREMDRDRDAYRVIYDFEFTIEHGSLAGTRKMLSYTNGPYNNLGTAKQRLKALKRQAKHYKELEVIVEEIQVATGWNKVDV